MNAIDIAISILLLFGLVNGFIKGFFIEIASLVALVGGLYGAIHFSFYASDILVQYVHWNPKYIQIVAFAITFLIIIIMASLIGKLLTKLVETVALGFVNKLFGGLFGILKVAFILSIILLFFNRINKNIPFVKDETIQKSVLYEPIQKLAPFLFPNFAEVTSDKDTIKTI